MTYAERRRELHYKLDQLIDDFDIEAVEQELEEMLEDLEANKQAYLEVISA